MTAPRTAPSVALVVLWPQSASGGAAAERLVRFLAERRLPSTWALEQPAQALALRSLRTPAAIDPALLVAEAAGAVEAVERRLQQFLAADEPIESVYAAAWPRGAVERRLRQAGVRAIVSPPIRAAASTVRSLPFGLWSVTPHIAAPSSRRWRDMLRRTASALSVLPDDSPAIACIDLARAASSGSRSWRGIEKVVDEAARLAAAGAAQIVTVAQLAAELSATHAPRPQQSILKLAA